jgi:hypothetical protein
MLIEAMQILEDETCKECGSPIWICRNEAAANVGFKVKTTKCFAKAELERWQEKEDKKKTKRKAYGERPYIVAYTYDGSEMPTRSDYYQNLAKSDEVE